MKKNYRIETDIPALTTRIDFSQFTRPSPIDLLGLPTGKYYQHAFPKDVSAGIRIRVTLSGIEKQLLNFPHGEAWAERSKQQRKRKQRHLELVLIYPHKIRPIRLFLDQQARIAFVYGFRDSPLVLKPEILKPSQVQLLTFFDRPGKRKILNACFFGPGHPFTSIERALSGCHYVLAIDTNYRDIPNVGIVAVTTAIRAVVRGITEEACHVSSVDTLSALITNPSGKPELFGIWTALQKYFSAHPDTRTAQIGVITDTEFGLVEAINRREAPIFGNNMLPDNVTLFFATGDSGSTEFIPNLLIRKCDSASTLRLEQYVKELESHPSGEVL